jgi:hypothetical protein
VRSSFLSSHAIQHVVIFSPLVVSSRGDPCWSWGVRNGLLTKRKHASPASDSFSVALDLKQSSLVALFGRVVDWTSYVVCNPYVISMACTVLLLWPGRRDASMVWTVCLSMLVSMIHICLRQ